MQVNGFYSSPFKFSSPFPSESQQFPSHLLPWILELLLQISQANERNRWSLLARIYLKGAPICSNAKPLRGLQAEQHGNPWVPLNMDGHWSIALPVGTFTEPSARSTSTSTSLIQVAPGSVEGGKEPLWSSGE